MYFDSFSSLVHMDGHGLYVWSTYGIGLLVIGYNVIAPLLNRKKTLRRIQRQLANA